MTELQQLKLISGPGSRTLCSTTDASPGCCCGLSLGTEEAGGMFVNLLIQLISYRINPPTSEINRQRTDAESR